MAFTLGKKKGSKSSFQNSELWRVDHIQGNEFVTILLDQPLISKGSNIKRSIDEEILEKLQTLLARTGVNSYVITSALRTIPTQKDLSAAKKTEFYIASDSGWFEEVIKPARAAGYTANVVVPFGAALYQIIKAADITVEDLIYPYFENYVYVGHGWIGDYDCFLFPQFPVYDIFCPNIVKKHEYPKIELGSWKFVFFLKMLQKIAAKQYQFPDDMTDPILKEIGEDYNKDKEQAIQEVEDFLKSRFNSEICAFDLETSGFNAWKDKIRCITLAFDSITGYYLEWRIFAENEHLLNLLSDMILSCKHRVTVNGKFDIKFLWVNKISRLVTVTEDAMTLSHILCSGRHKGLKSQAYYWTPHGGYDYQLDVYRNSLKKKGIKDPSYYDIPKPILFPYATMDAVITVRVWLSGLKRVEKFDREHPTEKPIEHTGGVAYTVKSWYDFVMKLYPIICDMEYEGLHLDQDIIENHREIFRNLIRKAREKLADIFNVPVDFDFGSSTQLGRLLEERGWPCHGRAANGGYETSGDCFVEWTRDGMKGVQELKDFRKASVCLKTYLGDITKKTNQKTGAVTEDWSGWPQYAIEHEDGSSRLHCDFGVCATETFRMISKDPNLQNVPTHSTEGSITKMSFTVPRATMYFVTDEKDKEWEVTELGVVNTLRGYVAAGAITEDDTVVDIGEETVLEYDAWKTKGIEPIGIETMWNRKYLS